MHRLFLAGAAETGSLLEIEGREAHHALHVLRITPGETVAVLDGEGAEMACSVRQAKRHSLTLEVKGRRKSAPPPCEITLFQALPKGKAFETILQKATELGAYRIVPLLSERVIARAEKHEKWQWVMIDAMKQCGNPWMPILEVPLKFEDAVKRVSEFDISLVGSLHPGRRHAREWLEGKNVQEVAIWVGPEGDFTAAEMEALMSEDVKPMSLGRLVLRSDTAAISALAIVNYELEGVSR